MKQDNQSLLNQSEQTRLVLVAALVATAITAIQIIPNALDDLVTALIKGVFAISAFSGFLYILLTAALLKFAKSDEIGGWPFSEKFRTRCYNYCIDSYGVQLGSLIMFGCAYALNWTFEESTWDWRVAIGAVLTLMVYGFTLYITRYRRRS